MSNTVEGNKVIAEFMGLPKRQDGIFEQLAFLKDSIWQNENILKYHSSWDWLMPVVEKIEADCFASVEIIHMGCIINHNDPEKTKTARFGKPKIRMVYECILAYLEWYNKQPKP